MLNDLFLIERGLSAHGISISARHPDIKDMAKGRAIRVRLGSSGKIAGLEIVPDAGRGVLWTLRDGQHNGFPGLKAAFQVKTPDGKTETFGLLRMTSDARLTHEENWRAAKDVRTKREELQRLLQSYPLDSERAGNWPSTGHRARIQERLNSLKSLAQESQTAAVPVVFERFLTAIAASPSFLEQLKVALTERLSKAGEEWLDPVREALFSGTALAIDVRDGEFGRDAGDTRQIAAVSKALSGPTSEEAAGSAESVCALTGRTAKLHSGNFPQPNLPGLGQTYIFSRNKDIPSLTRFRRTADASFPIDADLAGRLSGSITALTQEENKGRTWRLIPAETGERPDLLVVSLAAPGISAADAFADDEEVRGEAALKELASRTVAESLGKLEHERPNDEVTVLVLRTVDPANRKIIYNRRISAGDVWRAAYRWQQATSNTPEWLTLPCPAKGTTQVIARRPPYISPMSVVPISSIQFANAGRRRVGVIGVSAAEAFELFLDDRDKRYATKILRLLVRRHGGLLCNTAAAQRKGINYLRDFDPKADLRRDALRSVTCIGAVLHSLNRICKGNPDMPQVSTYVDDFAFRFGQLLAAADTVHVGYCNDIRNGDVPPNLLGNSVLSIAGSDPVRALAILQSRLKPYLAWAKRTDSIYRKAKVEESRGNQSRAIALRQGASHARRADEIAVDLHAMLGPYKDRSRTTDDSFRAELLLGYMAGLRKSASTTMRTTGDETDGGGEQ